MSFHSLLPKRSKFFLIYAFVIMVWMSLELIEFFGKVHLTDSISKLTGFVEICIGFSSLVIVYLVFRESKSLRKEIFESKLLIEKLNHKNLLSKSDREEFWKGVQKQYEGWGFSETESEIATYVLRGFSNQQIAGIRGTSLRTVETQTYTIYQKSGTKGKLDFIAYFILPLLPEEEGSRSFHAN
ncbi:helix-turn-helix transcriptional regulator [Leptospira idonii]|uniref:LuxR family transcriptional regulator n=1 Tax=Leptospira idonii TaxID=1193500 RepID=A0A4R9M271_9LEPT|nr:helix-turn-helix transcriptional regulator [Leptospira idonii]TGN20884.1 LuxR family transcriptional regulator [Leptospira idonii]